MVDWGVWKPPAKLTDVARMYSYYTWLNTWVGMRRSQIDMAVVEELTVMRGAKVARVLAHFEAIGCVVCKKHGLMVVRVKAGVARNLVLGMNPNSKKEDVLVEVRRQFPNLKFPPKNQGGEDVADAFVQAKAGPLAVG
jgi:Holliday junction resolvasome RuvABC endonuclease subunit